MGPQIDQQMYLNSSMDQQSMRQTQQARIRQNVTELEPDYFQFGRAEIQSAKSDEDGEEDQFAKIITPRNYKTQGGGSNTTRNTPKNSKGGGYVRPQSVTGEMPGSKPSQSNQLAKSQTMHPHQAHGQAIKKNSFRDPLGRKNISSSTMGYMQDRKSLRKLNGAHDAPLKLSEIKEGTTMADQQLDKKKSLHP